MGSTLIDVPDNTDFDYATESGANVVDLTAVFEQLNPSSVYLLRTGTMGGAGQFHTVYLEPNHGWILYNSSTQIYQLTNENGEVVETPHVEVREANEGEIVDDETLGASAGTVIATYPEWMSPPKLDLKPELRSISETKAIIGGVQLIVEDNSWGLQEGQSYFDFTELTAERTIAR